jgi:GH25 family lysozyme M1 (1,4-beta-N-acetylmuramidase)
LRESSKGSSSYFLKGGFIFMKKGIDVSYAQGNIDFSKINKNQVQFVIIRSSFGWEADQKDNQFERNYSGFKKLGIPVGAYHYSYAKTKEQAVKEVKYCLECIKGKSFELPVFIDMEEQICAAAGRRACTDVAKTFIETMEKSGYRSGIYINPNWLENYLYKDELIGKVNIWLAQWESSEPYCNCMLWQYNVGKAGSIKGISGDIDLDYCMTEIKSSTPKTSATVISDRDKFLETARSYIGKNGYYVCKTKLGLNAVYDWCAFAISAIMKDCGFIGKYTNGVNSYASDEGRNGDGKYGIWFLKGAMSVKAGDLIMFRYSGLSPIDKYSASHIGIVEKVDGNTITTLEGNVEGSNDNWSNTSKFKRKTRYLSDGSVHSFFRPYWNDNSDTKNYISDNKKTVKELAKEVIAGKWDSGDNRKNKLMQAGYDYNEVQKEVNKQLLGETKQLKSTDEIAREVISGKWGVGDERKAKLTAAGYNYSTIQNRVNYILSAKSIDTIAKEVIAGKWGNGDERKKRLTAAGYNYSEVQKKVNQLML